MAAWLAAIPPASFLGLLSAGVLLGDAEIPRETGPTRPVDAASIATTGSMDVPVTRELEMTTPVEGARDEQRAAFAASPLRLANQPQPDLIAIAAARAPDSLREQVELMTDPRRSLPVRRTAACALGSVHTSASLALIAGAARDADPTNRELSALALAGWPRGGLAREHLLGLLGDPVAAVRAASAKALVPDREIGPELSTCLRAETDLQVVEWLARGLAAHGEAEALVPLAAWSARCEQAAHAVRAICARTGVPVPAELAPR